MRKEKAPIPAEDDGPSKAWLDSYADAMTLLLAFFVLLYAFSLLDEKKFAEFKYGVEQAFSFSSPAVPEGTGFLDEGVGINENAGQLAVVPADVQNEIDALLDEIAADQQVTPDEVEALREAVEAALKAAAVQLDLFQVETDPRGVVVTLDERLLFPSGSARIDGAAAPALGAIAEVLADLDNQILVEGHTDSVPTSGTVWPTNWELSAARATAALRCRSQMLHPMQSCGRQASGSRQARRPALSRRLTHWSTESAAPRGRLAGSRRRDRSSHRRMQR